MRRQAFNTKSVEEKSVMMAARTPRKHSSRVASGWTRTARQSVRPANRSVHTRCPTRRKRRRRSLDLRLDAYAHSISELAAVCNGYEIAFAQAAGHRVGGCVRRIDHDRAPLN